jgi:parallel beta-helix repeat protein
MKKKLLTITIIFLFVETCIIPFATSELTNDIRQTTSTTIITVDDEPGDADFTSIKEAVNASTPGDTIEVYSGTYFEHEIIIATNEITLLGIAHELGDGDDSGSPSIKGNKSLGEVLRVEASNVIISNLTVENSNGYNAGCIKAIQNNITISDCIFYTVKEGINPNTGISFTGDNIRIINNQMNNCNPGIHAGTGLPGSLTITNNVITECGIYGGIYLSCNQQNVSGNRISRCDKGINIHGSNNIIYGNEIESCHTGISNYEGSNNIISGNNIEFCPIGFSNEWGGGNRIIKNNFKNYNNSSWNEPWWMRQMVFPYGFDKKDRWIGNYWDTWTGIGPKKIQGVIFVGWVINGEFGWGFVIPIPGVEFDRQPAKEPFNILYMS